MIVALIIIVGACICEGVSQIGSYITRRKAKHMEITTPDSVEEEQSLHLKNSLKAMEQCSTESERISMGVYCAREAYLRKSLEDFTKIVSVCVNINYHLGGRVTDQGHKNTTLLHECIKDGAYDFAKVLIEHDADPSIGISRSWELTKYEAMHATPLHSAVQDERIELVKLLLEAGADHSAVDGDGYTPLCVAVRNDKIAIARTLLAGGANPSQVHDTVKCPLLCANSAAMAKLLVYKGADVNMVMGNGYPLLSMLIYDGKAAIARYILKEYQLRFDLRDKDGQWLDRHPLFVAYRANEFDVFKELVEFSYPNQLGAWGSIQETVVELDSYDYARVLLKRMVRLGLTIDSTLLYCAKSRRMQEMLVQFGADPTIKSPEYGKKTPDEYMVYRDRKLVWRDLIERAPGIVAEHQRKLLAEAVGLEDETAPVKRRM
ncbi:TPA: ankyrin repeat domain-containing protein [Stenotrophomonas maltophilia]|uniref:ankyrin repeat domain-containing protein n=1 Tax=Stenotrophomonas maltophilia TaxID=40324 RepID=UPI0015953B9D|nr:ankyrin repeat domain-containing protein [Stenotrophomonas maltophilia]HDX0898285.1 ankyrin repeat domain-containing protein [Stenotrophomonas maltophilia]HDX0916967.1 ankyrin repeat domain-containing protein [Stenotrophomonas maltophilia]